MPEPNSHIDDGYAIKTWRYLRLAMVAVVVGLGVAIAYEHAQADCFQTSISAYYYTPARSVFVSALVGIAVCMVCLRGNTVGEDLLLNLAGMFAPVVAFVPTPDPGSCMSVHNAVENRVANVANNVTALLAVGAIGLAIAAIMLYRERPARMSAIATAAAAGLWLAALLGFELARGAFEHDAHYTAAILMFLCIIVVVGINAREYENPAGRRTLVNLYTAIAAAMALASLGIGIAGALGWRHATIAIETVLIVLFALFWVRQTIELWGHGLRRAAKQ